MTMEREPGWLTTYRCTVNDRHLLYLEGALEGFPEESAGPAHVEELWCLWGDGGVLERLPGPFRVVEMALFPGLEVDVPMDRIPGGA